MRSKAISTSPKRSFQRRGSKVIARSLRGFATSFSSSVASSANYTSKNAKCDFIKLLVIFLLVLLTQWVLLTYLTPFFPQYAESLGISNEMTGIIFACYPVGAMIMAPLVGFFIQSMGTKLTVCIGLAIAGVFTMLFGLSKDYFGVSAPNQQYLFIVFSFIYGMGSTLADTGMLVAVEKMCTAGNLARILALGEIAVGVGSLIGPGIGGFLINYGGTNCSSTDKGFIPDATFRGNTSRLGEGDGAEYGCWLTTFTVMAGSAFLTMLLVILLLPGPPKKPKRKFSTVKSSVDDSVVVGDNEYVDANGHKIEDKGESKTNCCQLIMQYELLIPVLTYFLSQTSVCILNPVLALRLADPDTFNMDSSTIGLVWLISAFTYMVGSLLLGLVVDKLPPESTKGYVLMLTVAAAGPLLAGVGWVLVGPLRIPFLTGNDPFEPLIPSLPAMFASQALIGIGSAAATIPTIPLMLYWVPEHKEGHRALITSSFTSVYTACSASGNVLGGVLFGILGFRDMASLMVAICFALFVMILVVIACKALQSRRPAEDATRPKAGSDGSGRGWEDSFDGNAPLLNNMQAPPKIQRPKDTEAATKMTAVVGENGPPPPLPTNPTPTKAAARLSATADATGRGNWSPVHGTAPPVPPVPWRDAD